MKIPFGATDSDGKWWDGRDWRKWSEHDLLRIYEILSRHDEDNCHVDGVFKCPRCRKMHYIVSNYDLLCDGCVEICLDSPDCTLEVKNNILEWKEKARKHYQGQRDPDIIILEAKRQELEDE